MNAVLASIIIRTFNEEKHLALLLDSLQKQSHKNYEVIILDSGSTDNTLSIARKYPVKILTIKAEDFSFGYSLNVGCQNAAGEYLVFISAHTYPTNEDWLLNIIKPFEDAKIGMVYGRQIGNETTKLPEERDLKNNFRDKSNILVEESFGNNANAAVRKSLWAEIPFDERLPGLEDIDWVHKIQKRGFYVYYKADAVIYHIHNETYRQIYNRFKREAIAYKTVFPQYHYDHRKEIFNHILLAMMDCYYGIYRKKPLVKFLSIIPYRSASFKGLHDGYTYAGKITEKLKKEWFFPEKNLSVVIHGIDKHRLQEIEIPSLKDDEVLISVKYVGVCSTDLDVLAGGLNYYKTGWAKYPIVPGHEFSGIVAKKGNKVQGLKVGDKIVGECILGCGECENCLKDIPINCKDRKEVGVLNYDGAYAHYIKMAARFIHKLPADANLRKAVLIEPLAVSIRGIRKLVGANGGLSKKVAVLGHGTIGNLCAQLMVFKGHKVTVFDHNSIKTENLTKGIDACTQITGMGDFDYIIEATGRVEVLKKVLNESLTGAKILLLGLPYSAMDFNFESVVCFDKTIIGSLGSAKADFQEAIDIYPKLNVDNLIKNVFPLEEYETAWKNQKEGKISKAILNLSRFKE